jgi:phenylalanyl-tRNA synthetase alpha chain
VNGVSDRDLISEIEDTTRDGVARVTAARTLDELRSVEIEVLGKKARLTTVKKALGALGPDQRRVAGQALNEARRALEAALADRRSELDALARAQRLEQERLDLTESRDPARRGHHHLVTQTRDRLEDVFVGMGFTVAEGPEVETDFYNFEALNIPAAHPARGMWDTLYVDLGEPETVLLRTHTSPVQIRVMQAAPPPIAVVAPGRVYRRDTADASHLPVFHQIEGLVVDRQVTFGDLAGTLEAFTTAYFGGAIHSRLRPSYFPFTEPSAEYDINCIICEGQGCRTCGQTGWLELGGCGMVHPNVFRAVGLDPEEWTGFAFGFGIDRLALMRHGVDDIRELMINDVRFLEQF